MVIRDYRPEDLPRILELYNSTGTSRPHFARDERLLEHLVRYAENREGHIFVAANNDEITGWSIVSIDLGERGLRLGNIVELNAKDVSSLGELVEASQEYSAAKNVDAIIAAPPLGTPGNIVFKDWLQSETGVMMGKMLSFSSFLQALLIAHEKEIRKHFAGKRFAFEVDEEYVEVEPTSEKVEISESASQIQRNLIKISMSAQVFLEVVFGHRNLFTGYLTSKVKTEGARDVTSVLKLLRILRMTDSVYVSNSDRL